MISYIGIYGPRNKNGNITKLLIGVDRNMIVSVEKANGLTGICITFAVTAKEISDTIRIADHQGIYKG